MDPALVTPIAVTPWQQNDEVLGYDSSFDEGIPTLGAAIQNAIFAEHTLLALCRCRSLRASVYSVMRFFATLFSSPGIVFLLLVTDATDGTGPEASLMRIGVGAATACIPGVLHALLQRYAYPAYLLECDDQVVAFDAESVDLDSSFESTFESSFGSQQPMQALPATLENDEDCADWQNAVPMDTPDWQHAARDLNLQQQHGEMLGKGLVSQFKQLAPSQAQASMGSSMKTPGQLTPLKLPVANNAKAGKQPAPRFPPPVLGKVAEDASPSVFGMPTNSPSTLRSNFERQALATGQRPPSSMSRASEPSIFSVRTGTSIKTATSKATTVSSRSTVSVISFTRGPAVEVQKGCDLEDLKERYIGEITQRNAEKPDERLDLQERNVLA